MGSKEGCDVRNKKPYDEMKTVCKFSGHFHKPFRGFCKSKPLNDNFNTLAATDLIFQVSSGVYVLSSLLLRVQKKICKIIEKYLDCEPVNAVQCVLPLLQPASMWQATGRWEKYGPELFQLRDRNDKSFCLAPTHEELVTAYVSTQLCSYKQLPVKLYQIEKKFRDELRPAYGLYRSREFLMKDLYCFDRNSESALATYNIIKQTYLYIMKNLGLVSEFVPAKPDLMGETTSHELVTEFHAGRQKLVTCERCSSTTFFGKEDVCVVCKSKMRMWNGVEVGHLFLLSSSYVDSFSCHFVDESGVRQPPIMSCYGLGISRLLAVLADIYSDSEGYRFPLSIVPYKVAITHYGQKKDDIAIFENLCISVCNRLLAALPDLVDEVIVDDRHYMNPSQKIADLRGLGFPVIVALGREMLRSGQEAVEVRLRRDRRKIYIPFDALDTLVEVVRREVVV